MKKTGKHSLQTRIVAAIVALVTLAILAVSISACVVTLRLYQDQMNRIISSKLGESNGMLGSWLQEKIDFTDFIAREVVDRGYLDDHAGLQGFLIDCMNRDEDTFDCYTGFADASCIFGGGWEPAPGEYDPTTRDWYQASAATDEVLVSEPYVDAETGRIVITCSKRLMKDGSLYGVLAQDIFIDTVGEVVNALSIDESGYSMLSTADGNLIVHHDPELGMHVDADQNEVLHSLDDAFKAFSYAGERAVDLVDCNGMEVKYTEVPVAATGWRLGYALSSKEYNAEIWMVIVMFILMTVAFAAVIAVIVALLLRRTFKPLAALAEKSKTVSKGNLAVTFSYGKQDEIGDVCNAIEENNRVVKLYIDDIARRLSEIANGDFSGRSDVDYIGDYAQIRNSLDRLCRALHKVFGQIETASQAVFSGAGEVSRGSGRLSDSVAGQTRIIDEIASGMSDLQGRIDRNVTRTDDARVTAREASDAVEQGSRQMSSLLGAMDDISDSSRQIEKILKTIEDIAFQTNILALNASVEAARAGAAGKGFAVVADEVRNLAGKSAEASAQTAKLIGQSVQAVRSGVEIAAETSKSLELVVARTGEIDKIIVEINEESHGQRERVDEVSARIGDVSEFVNASSSNAQESAGAAQELNEQAALLKGMIDDFRS